MLEWASGCCLFNYAPSDCWPSHFCIIYNTWQRQTHELLVQNSFEIGKKIERDVCEAGQQEACSPAGGSQVPGSIDMMAPWI